VIFQTDKALLEQEVPAILTLFGYPKLSVISTIITMITVCYFSFYIYLFSKESNINSSFRAPDNFNDL
jgi:hypothetical protein